MTIRTTTIGRINQQSELLICRLVLVRALLVQWSFIFFCIIIIVKSAILQGRRGVCNGVKPPLLVLLSHEKNQQGLRDRKRRVNSAAE
jgi:hypothetical protein